MTDLISDVIAIFSTCWAKAKFSLLGVDVEVREEGNPDGLVRLLVRGTAIREGETAWTFNSAKCVNEPDVVRHTAHSLLKQAEEVGVTVKSVLVTMPSAPPPSGEMMLGG